MGMLPVVPTCRRVILGLKVASRDTSHYPYTYVTRIVISKTLSRNGMIVKVRLCATCSPFALILPHNRHEAFGGTLGQFGFAVARFCPFFSSPSSSFFGSSFALRWHPSRRGRCLLRVFQAGSLI